MIEAAATVYVLLGLSYLAGTFVLSRRKRSVPPCGTDPDLFVFVVPALNESAVIEETVLNLRAACGARGRVLVIDDGSDDGTADIVEALGDPFVMVLRRTLPNARQGKGRALNHAYRFLRERLISEGIDLSRVVLGIVDADGRIQPDALADVSPYFRHPRTGAVQLLVRIRNRTNWLTLCQDYEFVVFSALTQTAREHVGSVGLGGNGQFTRLSALTTLGENPWTDCLTEDLDLGVRLAINGWDNRFAGETSVDQQGLTSVSRLVRQRTRWAHGHFQCWKLIPALVRSQLPTLTVLDFLYYLMAPALVLTASGLFTVSFGWTIYQTITQPGFWLTPFGGLVGLLLYGFSFGPAIALALVYRHRTRDISLLTAIALGHLLFVFNYIWYLAEWKALVRIVTGKGGWSKTARVTEPLMRAG